MSVPAKKCSKQRTKQRRSHHAIGKIKLVKCANCEAFIQPHRICNTCGYYKGRVVVNV